MDTEVTGRAKGGKARADALSPEERSAIAKSAAAARWGESVPKAEHSGELKLGSLVFPCSVLADGTRVLTQSDFMEGMGMYYSGWVSSKQNKDVSAGVPNFLGFKNLKPFLDRHLGDLQQITVKYRTEKGSLAHGIRAETIPKLCEVWLDAEEQGKLGARQRQIAAKAKLIIRALAHTGIIALVDEATGYQKVRSKDALAQILEAFIAKELQPWLKTFPADFYQEMFRLRGLPFPTDGRSVQRPQYFGILTNNVVYDRIAPGVREELQRGVPRNEAGRPTAKYFQKLTHNTGYPKLREHLGSVVTIMKFSNDWSDFMQKLDRIHPKFGSTLPLGLEYKKEDDSGRGL